MTVGPADFGPIYAETDLSRFPVEPWNAASNIIFLFIIIYFGWHTKLNFRRFPLIVGSLPVLAIGYIGGTLFHATRAHSIFLIMDFVPIGLLCITASLFFWVKLVGRPYLAALLCCGTILIPRLAVAAMGVPRGIAISFGYVGLAAAIILPALLFQIRTKQGQLYYLLGAFGFFGIAILCRILDKTRPPIIPMGTHFLWHTFGGISVFFLMKFLLQVEKGPWHSSIDHKKSTSFSSSS